MAPIMIDVKNLSKRYRIGLKDEMPGNICCEIIVCFFSLWELTEKLFRIA
ncbi:MAG: hypothetical protein JW885_15430 [Deltaproteobacteria bacterium]|nr:hypothetical protein [Candidatus Zymogenaceae bacterium]